MTHSSGTRRTHGGFTLAEMAVVLVIVSLLIGGMLMPFSAQQDNRRISDTQKMLDSIQTALIGFAVINGRLPCPATPTIPSGAAGAGLEATTGTAPNTTCASLSGVLPWATLGIPEIDAWGSRFTYRVTARFAQGTGQPLGLGCIPPSPPTTASFALCSPGDITVSTATAGGVTVASALPAVVVSHGKNAVGAYSTQGLVIPGNASTDEQTNASGTANFVSNNAIDDQLTWVPTSLLMSRMLSAGKLP
ncbi:MAG: prepilin-type N-terminal cleavage/methylation domain-containing protein [Proteobacteria bacterium]|nr:prepilin-type N-terminal cleavage/methylation domain-containing protein [Pseudomonadota bacterium]HQR03744.1 prepilin-type N-terminal cleavage/methylation domain-containing protein [Rhodocyclaceae bacterium]